VEEASGMSSTSRGISSGGGREGKGRPFQGHLIDPNSKKRREESERKWEFLPLA
jgi:hypothetical protein